MKNHLYLGCAGALAAAMLMAAPGHATPWTTSDKKFGFDRQDDSLYEYYGASIASGSYRTTTTFDWNHDGAVIYGALGSELESSNDSYVRVSLFDKSNEIARMRSLATVDSKPDPNYPGYTLAQGGLTVLGKTVEWVDNRGSFPRDGMLKNSINVSRSVSKTFFTVPFIIALGPVAITLTGSVGGSAGVTTAATADLGATLLDTDTAASNSQATANVFGSVSAEAGVPGVVGLGIIQNLSLIRLTATPTARVTRARVSSSTNQHKYCTRSSNTLELSSLAAKLSVYGHVYGIRYQTDVFNFPQDYPLWTGTLWNNPSLCTTMEASAFW